MPEEISRSPNPRRIAGARRPEPRHNGGVKLRIAAAAAIAIGFVLGIVRSRRTRLRVVTADGTTVRPTAAGARCRAGRPRPGPWACSASVRAPGRPRRARRMARRRGGDRRPGHRDDRRPGHRHQRAQLAGRLTPPPLPHRVADPGDGPPDPPGPTGTADAGVTGRPDAVVRARRPPAASPPTRRRWSWSPSPRTRRPRRPGGAADCGRAAGLARRAPPRFCGIDVAVDPGVYVPRWQSETLAERAADLLPPDGTAVDLATGSGAVAVVLRSGVPGARVVATEVDPRAVACARRNGVDVREGPLDDPLPDDARRGGRRAVRRPPLRADRRPAPPAPRRPGLRAPACPRRRDRRAGPGGRRRCAAAPAGCGREAGCCSRWARTRSTRSSALFGSAGYGGLEVLTDGDGDARRAGGASAGRGGGPPSGGGPQASSR